MLHICDANVQSRNKKDSLSTSDEISRRHDVVLIDTSSNDGKMSERTVIQ